MTKTKSVKMSTRKGNVIWMDDVLCVAIARVVATQIKKSEGNALAYGRLLMKYHQAMRVGANIIDITDLKKPK